MLKKFINDDRGEVSVAALVLITAIVCIGALVGLVAIRDTVTQQFGDVGAALNALDQSFDFEIIVDSDEDGLFENNGDDVVIDGSFTDDPPALVDAANAPPACLQFVNGAGANEGDALPAPTSFP